jgi:hypothetical protein
MLFGVALRTNRNVNGGVFVVLARCPREIADAVVARAQKVGVGVVLGCEASQSPAPDV